MKIYWMFLGLALVMCIWCSTKYQVVEINHQYEKKALWMQAIVFFSVIIFFCGLRSGIADTGTYIHMFNNYPSSVMDIEWDAVEKERGFYLLSVLYRQFISTDFHGWLFLIALISGFATMIAFKRYSYTFGMSCFLFIATTIFTYFVNGMRQYICISIVFACSCWIIDKQWNKFFILVLLLSTIHVSVLIFIPIYFLVRSKPWSWQMYVSIILAILCGMGFEQVFPVFGSILEDTAYAGYVDYVSTQGVGSNIFRLLIAMVPCVIAFIGRRVVEQEGNPIIRLSINMSVINLCLYFIATVSSGMLMGRLAIYFDIYNLILLPWLLKHVFNKKSSELITALCIGAYTVYFYYQMVVTWDLPYESDILNLFYY